MYVRQVIGSAFAGLAIGYWALNSGYNIVTAAMAMVLIFFLIRWSLATIGRTRYWLDRGTRNIYYEYCPNCETRRHRLSGDWILQCGQCGWKPGWPVIRWVRRSVPAIQFRRSISRLSGIFAFLSFGTLIVSLQPQFASGIPQFTDLPSLQDIVVLIGAGTILGIILLWMLFFRKWYCRKCGQYLGRGDPPNRCPNCGSNRFSNQDPGIAKKIKIVEGDE